MGKEEIQKVQDELGFSVSKMALELNVARGTYDKWQSDNTYSQKPPAIALTAVKMLKFIIDRGLLDDFHDLP